MHEVTTLYCVFCSLLYSGRALTQILVGDSVLLPKRHRQPDIGSIPEEEEVELDIPGEEPALPQNREAAGHSTELRNGAKTFVEPEHPPHVP